MKNNTTTIEKTTKRTQQNAAEKPNVRSIDSYNHRMLDNDEVYKLSCRAAEIKYYLQSKLVKSHPRIYVDVNLTTRTTYYSDLIYQHISSGHSVSTSNNFEFSITVMLSADEIDMFGFESGLKISNEKAFDLLSDTLKRVYSS